MPEKIKLYRVENPNILVNPLIEAEGGVTHPDIRGQWFSDRLDKALGYLPKATQHRPLGEHLRPFESIDGAVIHIAEINKSEVDRYRASNHPIVEKHRMDIENDDYILPRERIVNTLKLDDLVGESRGKMNNFDEFQKAKDRVRGAVVLHLHELNTKRDL